MTTTANVGLSLAYFILSCIIIDADTNHCNLDLFLGLENHMNYTTTVALSSDSASTRPLCMTDASLASASSLNSPPSAEPKQNSLGLLAIASACFGALPYALSVVCSMLRSGLLPSNVHSRIYYGFCKNYLWLLLPPAMHFDRPLWRAFLSANRLFEERILELLGPEADDMVWVHEYHLLALPTFLRHRIPRLRLGFFLHSPLRALLDTDLLGFHTFDYARHFLSFSSRMLGLHYKSKRGHLSIEYYGKTVTVKILPTDVHMGQL